MALFACIFTAAPISVRYPSAGLDPSWMVALDLARRQHLHFGSELVFTYGPWGFVDYPVAVGRFSLVVAALFAVLTIAASWVAFDRVLGRVLPEPGAAIAATLVVVLASEVVTVSSVLLATAALVAMDFVGAEAASRHWWIPAAVAGCAAFLTQVKFSEGVVLTAIAISCAVLAPAARMRRLCEVLAALLATSVVAWLSAGQALGDLPVWLWRATEVARGYTEAMSLEGKPNVLPYLLIAAVVGVSVVYLVRLAAARRDRRAVLGVVAITGLMLFLGFREGTGRHGPGHQHYFYLFALPAMAWFLPSARSVVLRSAALAATVALSTVSLLPAGPHVALDQWSKLLQNVVDDNYRGAELARAQTAAQRVYGLSPAVRTAVSGLPVAVDPTETTLAWAYGLRWRPVPAFQSYVAYTAMLDRLNARAITDAPADQAILRSASRAIDGRNTLWDPPRYLLAELCHYRVAASDRSWMLLRKAANRCSAPARVSTRQVEADQPVGTPRAGANQILVVSFAERPAGTAVRIGRLLNKGFSPLTVRAGGSTFRLPRALADGPLLVSLASSAGWPAAFGGTTAYESLTFSEAGTATFSVIDLAPEAGH